jgi:hypothetical protein
LITANTDGQHLRVDLLERVDAFVAQTLNDPVALGHVLERMTRMRDPQGVYAQGGCIDTTREHPKQVHASSCDLVLPPWP